MLARSEIKATELWVDRVHSEEDMSDAVRLALLIGGLTLIAISITAGTVLISQWMRQRFGVEQGAGKSEPTMKAGMGSCIGSGMSIVGNLECNGPAQVFGRIEGELRASDLFIGTGAQVEGSVMAQDVTVCGHVKGTIHAVRVRLRDGGTVNGDIFHQGLSIDETSLFEGSSRRVETLTDLPSSADAHAARREDMQSLTHENSNVLTMQPVRQAQEE
jgi:cytoskeletal protein CcmA (bactofilin family)